MELYFKLLELDILDLLKFSAIVYCSHYTCCATLVIYFYYHDFGHEIDFFHYISKIVERCYFTQNIEILCVLKDGFVNNTTLNNHVKAKHSDEKPYVCEHCPARYATSMSLSTHRSRVHRVNKAGNS